ncbi:MAG TPA: hypothetical protein VFB60_00110 [Ktedonobacteraceae bacterium]|nr:hypothetical protein [Ktedonobacteraceae bacterium]
MLAVGAADRQHLPLPVSAFGASSQRVQRLWRSPVEPPHYAPWLY